MTTQQLPPAARNQNYVTISALKGGSLTLGDRHFVAPADADAKRTVPSLCFLITHSNPPKTAFTGKRGPMRLMFDLGFRSRKERYKEVMQRHIETRAPYSFEPGLLHQLEEGGLSPEDIDVVMLSHVHWDHHGDPEDFPNSTFIVGDGALDVLEHGLEGKGSHQQFEPDLLRRNKVLELPPAGIHAEINGVDLEWKPLGPFASAIDLLKDGSVYVVDTPGHLPGHLNLLCRVGPGKWVCLCGDAFHDPRLLTGEKEIGTWEDEKSGTLCVHLHKDVAQRSIEKLRLLRDLGGVELVAAHDEVWLEKNQGALFPGTIAV